MKRLNLYKLSSVGLNAKTAFMVMVAVMIVANATAKPRTMKQMEQAARSAISVAGKAFAPRKGASLPMKVVESRDNLVLFGYADGAYAVVPVDDTMPEVIGISTTPYSAGSNESFEWWLRTANKVLGEAVRSGRPLRVTPPDTQLYPAEVQPLMTTKWDQLEPYNNYLPEGIYTGCVATAMAQVLNYYKTPVHGIGERTLKINTSMHHNVTVTATFGEDYYDWDNMLEEYRPGQYTEVQGNAVALLMRDCGVAASMMYGGEKEGGSGTYLKDAAEGLKRYLGFENAECIYRNEFSEPAWMNRIYKEISTRGPVVYSGADMDEYAGHAFVLHGYRSDGKVYVNWGWSGADDGWYDVATLQMPGYSFSGYQDMIVGLEAMNKDLLEVTISVEEAGTLESLLPENALTSIEKLNLSGNINSTDMRTLRILAGVDEKMKRTEGLLRELDMTDVNIVSGGLPYIIDGKNELTTADNELPERAFYGCSSLRKLTLPASATSIGCGAINNMSRLKDLIIPESGSQNYTVDDNFIYADKEKKIIASILPNAQKEIEVANGVITIGSFSMASAHVKKLQLPSTVKELGRSALYKCEELSEIRIATSEPPAVGKNGLDGILFAKSKLYVPTGSKQKYADADGWYNFKLNNGYVNYDNIVEYDVEEGPMSIISLTGETVKGAVYDITGRRVLPTSDAQSLSALPAGIYIIDGKKYVKK